MVAFVATPVCWKDVLVHVQGSAVHRHAGSAQLSAGLLDVIKQLHEAEQATTDAQALASSSTYESQVRQLTSCLPGSYNCVLGYINEILKLQPAAVQRLMGRRCAAGVLV